MGHIGHIPPIGTEEFIAERDRAWDAQRTQLLDSIDALVAKLRKNDGLPQRIGVYDYDSLTELLRNTWIRLYDSPPRDPQDIIQRMEAEILRWRQADHDEEESRL